MKTAQNAALCFLALVAVLGIARPALADDAEDTNKADLLTGVWEDVNHKGTLISFESNSCDLSHSSLPANAKKAEYWQVKNGVLILSREGGGTTSLLFSVTKTQLALTPRGKGKARGVTQRFKRYR